MPQLGLQSGPLSPCRQHRRLAHLCAVHAPLPAGRDLLSLPLKAVNCVLLSKHCVPYSLASDLDGFMSTIKIEKPLKFTWGHLDFWWLRF